MNKSPPNAGLMVLLLMFPQVVETIYSPVLPAIAEGFGVSESVAAQTLSIYFSAFAVGVVIWGTVADYLGRRKTMLLGLAVYGIAALGAVISTDFHTLLVFRALSAVGAAVGSVVTQTMLRDSFEGEALGRVFAWVGIGIAISPVIGMMTGGGLTLLGGYPAVFTALCVLALALCLVCAMMLPETLHGEQVKPRVTTVVRQLVRDGHIWRSAFLVAGFNVALFGYYLQGPFVFQRLGYDPHLFGYSGMVMAAGTLAGSVWNKRLVTRWRTDSILRLAALLVLAGGLGVIATIDSLWFLAPMLLVVCGFGLGIPNVLSQALVEYKAGIGTAGAWFGLMYYLLIGGGLALAGWIQNLGIVLSVCGGVCLLLTLTRRSRP